MDAGLAVKGPVTISFKIPDPFLHMGDLQIERDQLTSHLILGVHGAIFYPKFHSQLLGE
jgi:hypothetical protein